MTTHKINDREYIFLEVPEGAYNFRKSHNGRNVYEKWVKFDTDTDAIDGKVKVSNTAIDYNILGIASELTEEQAMKMVNVTHIGQWRDYEANPNSFNPCDEYQDCFLSAKESLTSLITSKGMNPERTLIIERKK